MRQILQFLQRIILWYDIFLCKNHGGILLTVCEKSHPSSVADGKGVILWRLNTLNLWKDEDHGLTNAAARRML